MWIAYDENGDKQGSAWAWSGYACKAHLDEMQKYGMNALRLVTAIDWWFLDGTWWTCSGQTQYVEYKQHLHDILTWASERGIYVIICPYQVVNWNTAYEEGWPTVREGLPYPPYSNEGADQYIPNELAFVNYIVALASEYKGHENFILELWNEPHGSGEAKSSWYQVGQDCIDAVRNAGVDNLIIFQWDYGVDCNLLYRGGSFVDWVGDTDCPKGEDVVYSTHCYRPYGGLGKVYDPATGQFLHYGYTYEEVLDALTLELIDWVGDTLNKPLLIGEAGMSLSASDQAEEREGFTNAFSIWNDWGLGYLGWWWDTRGDRRFLSTWPTYPDGVTLTAAGEIITNAIGAS